MTLLLWPLIKGLAALLVSGAVLALMAPLLPRLLGWWEQREAARLGLEPVAPVLPAREKTAAPEGPLPGPLAPEFPPPLAAATPVAAAEEPLVAAAIALALTLFQEEQQPAPAAAAGPSPWALAGRWLAMERRLNLPKR